MTHPKPDLYPQLSTLLRESTSLFTYSHLSRIPTTMLLQDFQDINTMRCALSFIVAVVHVLLTQTQHCFGGERRYYLIPFQNTLVRCQGFLCICVD